MIEYLNYVFNNVNELTELESIVELGRIMELAMKKVAEIRTDANCTNIDSGLQNASDKFESNITLINRVVMVKYLGEGVE
jgi:hypothetical protein